jgi:hypothetical protein
MKKNRPSREHPHKKEKRDYFSDKDPKADGGKHPSPTPAKNAGIDNFEEGQKDGNAPRRKKAA